MTTSPTLQRLPTVLAVRGVKRAKHYADIERGLWTRPVNIGRNFAAWPAHETEALVSAQIAGTSEERMRSLVTQLHERRKADFEALSSRLLNGPLAAAP